MDTALTTSSPYAVMPIMDLAQAVSRRQQMVGFVQGIMSEGIDYGKVPGTDKDTLLKPGAEKLTTFFGLSPRFVIVKEVEQWGDGGKESFLYYWYKCQLFRGDLLIGEGDGSCNSRESKYRWRWVGEENISPDIKLDTLKKREGKVSEFKFAIDKAETSGKYGKPQSYWDQFNEAIRQGKARGFQKSTAKGAVFPAWEIDTTVYRVPNEDIASLANTILKMAQKRALVAATLIAVNASEFFTQDIEDMDPGTVEGEFTSTPATTTTAPPQEPLQLATDIQIEAIRSLLRAAYPNTQFGSDADYSFLIKRNSYPPLGELKPEQAQAIIDNLTPQEPSKWLFGDEKLHKSMWAKAGELGLDREQVHKALSVEHIADYCAQFKDQQEAHRIATTIKLPKYAQMMAEAVPEDEILPF